MMTQSKSAFLRSTLIFFLCTFVEASAEVDDGQAFPDFREQIHRSNSDLPNQWDDFDGEVDENDFYQNERQDDFDDLSHELDDDFLRYFPDTYKRANSFLRIGKMYPMNRFIRIGRSRAPYIPQDANYFDTNDDEKRANSFLRIGKAPSSFVRIGKSYSDDIADYLDKRVPNFVRIGKAPSSFVRIGKSHSDDIQSNFDKRAPNFVRIGKAPSSFVRIGKAPSSFVRIGKAPNGFVRIGKSGEPIIATADEASARLKRDSEYNRDSRAPSSFVRIGKAPSSFVRIGKAPSSFVRIGKAPSSFVRIGKAPSAFVRIEKAPSSFVRIGKSQHIAQEDSKNLDFSELPDLISDKRAANFVRIGKAPSSFVRIGKAPSSFVRIGKAPSSFVRIGKAPSSFVRIGKSNVEDDKSDLFPEEAEELTGEDKRAPAFVRIGKSLSSNNNLESKRASSFLRIGKSYQNIQDISNLDKKDSRFALFDKAPSSGTPKPQTQTLVNAPTESSESTKDGNLPSSDEPIKVSSRASAFVRIGKIPSSAFVRIGKNTDEIMDGDDANRRSRGSPFSFVRIG